MLNVYKLLLIISLFKVSNCCHGPSFEKRIYSDIDYSTKYMYRWLVVIYNTNGDFFGISYGSIIHPKAVITAAIDMEGYDAKNLTVRTNCDVFVKKSFEDCTTRNVMKIIYPDDYDGQPTPEKFYALLILETPFYETPIISPINLIDNLELIRKDTCMVFHWLRLYSVNNDIYGMVPEVFLIPYINGEFDIDAMDEKKVKNTPDFIIKKDVIYTKIIKEKVVPWQFFGSPIVCPLRNDYSMPIQIGIATFALTIPLDKDQKPTGPMRHVGSLFLITDYYDEIMKKLNENIT